jgi:hypothetical protein
MSANKSRKSNSERNRIPLQPLCADSEIYYVHRHTPRDKGAVAVLHMHLFRGAYIVALW